MRKNGGASYLGLAVIILLVIAILYVGISALQDQRVYQREAAITPTPSITPRTVRITEDPALPTSTPTPCMRHFATLAIATSSPWSATVRKAWYQASGSFGVPMPSMRQFPRLLYAARQPAWAASRYILKACGSSLLTPRPVS